MPIGFTVASDAPSGSVVALRRRAHRHDGRRPCDRDGTVVVDENRICRGRAVRFGVRAGRGAPRRCSGAARSCPASSTSTPTSEARANGISSRSRAGRFVANLAYGVTTSHDPSNNTEMVFTNSEMVRAGKKLGPRLYSTGTILVRRRDTVQSCHRDYDDALAHLRRLKAVGCVLGQELQPAAS